MVFEEKKSSLLQLLHHLALHHNRDYYISMIPIVETLELGELDILETYQQSIDEECGKLFHSKKAFEPISHHVQSLITLQ